MADLRSTANDFKSTWEKEVDLEEEAKALRIDNILDDADEKPIAREKSILPNGSTEQQNVEVPAIKAMNKEEFEAMAAVKDDEVIETNGHRDPTEDAQVQEPDLLSDKRNWL